MSAYSGWCPPQVRLSPDLRDDRRGSRRIDFEAEVALTGGAEERTEEARVVNLSAGGVFVSTPSPHSIGDVLRVSLRLASGDELQGTVKVCSRLAGRGNGVAFFNLAPEQKFAIEALVRRHGSDGPTTTHAKRNVYKY